MFKFKDCNMRHKVLSQLLERHWVTCLFFTRTQSHNSERKRACAQQKGEITKFFKKIKKNIKFLNVEFR